MKRCVFAARCRLQRGAGFLIELSYHLLHVSPSRSVGTKQPQCSYFRQRYKSCAHTREYAEADATRRRDRASMPIPPFLFIESDETPVNPYGIRHGTDKFPSLRSQMLGCDTRRVKRFPESNIVSPDSAAHRTWTTKSYSR